MLGVLYHSTLYSLRQSLSELEAISTGLYGPKLWKFLPVSTLTVLELQASVTMTFFFLDMGWGL